VGPPPKGYATTGEYKTDRLGHKAPKGLHVDNGSFLTLRQAITSVIVRASDTGIVEYSIPALMPLLMTKDHKPRGRLSVDV
jgi:hypothetical protein